MSDNPFRDLPNSNPYAAPANRAEPANPLLIPGVILLAQAILFLLLLIASIPRTVVQLSAIDTSTPAGMGEATGMIVAPLVWIMMTLIIIAGAVGMIRLKGYSGAMTAAILAVIPVCSPCFVAGIPFGIWALIVLRRPEVKARFR